jgi:hypothetical protein
MFKKSLYAFLFTVVLPSAGLIVSVPLASAQAEAASATVSVEQVRAQWATMRKAYLDGVAPYAGQPQFAALLKEYKAALDETGASLEAYIALKQAGAATPPAALTPAVDKLIANLTRLKTLQGRASGNLITVLGSALKQQQQITQNAIKNMR